MKETAQLQDSNGKISGGSCLSRYMTAMFRTLLFLLVAGMGARASDPINAPVGGTSVPVAQPHVVAELIPETTTIEAGKPFDIALHLHCDPQWHTYWINPGDAGLATNITWTLPPGFSAGPIQWPTPEKHPMGPLITYGYGGDVYLLTTITPPNSDLPQHFDIKAKASWLACMEECIPGKADLQLTLDSGLMNLRLPVDNTDFFAQARERLPVANTRWDVKAGYTPDGKRIAIALREHKGATSPSDRTLYFLPEQPNVLSPANPSFNSVFHTVILTLPLQQNGDKPSNLSGVVISNQPLIGTSTSVYLSEFPLEAQLPKNWGQELYAQGMQEIRDEAHAAAPEPAQISSLALALPPAPPSSPVVYGGVGYKALPAPDLAAPPPATRALQEKSAAEPAAGSEGIVARGETATLIAVLGAAFIGGLILNLMPCVLPVLSLKVFSLMKHAGENPKTAWVQGVAFTAGVVLSFWVLAGLLLVLRSAGNHLGWGFQMQSPGFVLALIFLFFLLALNLFGVFELGSSLVGLDAKATGHLGGLASSFGNGALATLAATPCTAPFMGSALGFAAQQSAFIALLVFTFLALGMATPYLLLTIFPGALRFVPKPGAWMEAFKQFMGFLLMATVIFLVYVFGALVGQEQVPWLLLVLLIAGVAAWIYGRWTTPLRTVPVRIAGFILTFGLLAYAITWGVSLAEAKPEAVVARSATATTEGAWQLWTQDAVNAALDKGQPVFVDFTAAWCLSCKVNEQVALGTDAVKKAFADKNVALFRADWTHADPAITKTLEQFNRDGVPLYLVYSPKNKNAPQVLPEVLTPGIVLDALNKL